ncbi:hypothetical protein VNO78_33595 [Psophocarpus tetragonolobus]|uniref:Uncharacterized protein n=1 Tax=Psophocarpus tetragonolobus TaxID=3891 RepID=A0AAN9NXI2_PSOTE
MPLSVTSTRYSLVKGERIVRSVLNTRLRGLAGLQVLYFIPIAGHVGLNSIQPETPLTCLKLDLFPALAMTKCRIPNWTMLFTFTHNQLEQLEPNAKSGLDSATSFKEGKIGCDSDCTCPPNFYNIAKFKLF